MPKPALTQKQRERLARAQPRRHDTRDYSYLKAYGRSWQRLRLWHLSREPLCRECRRHGRVEGAAEVDHVLPLSRGGTNDADNLQSLCKTCHSRKTGKERT